MPWHKKSTHTVRFIYLVVGVRLHSMFNCREHGPLHGLPIATADERLGGITHMNNNNNKKCRKYMHRAYGQLTSTSYSP